MVALAKKGIQARMKQTVRDNKYLHQMNTLKIILRMIKDTSLTDLQIEANLHGCIQWMFILSGVRVAKQIYRNEAR